MRFPQVIRPRYLPHPIQMMLLDRTPLLVRHRRIARVPRQCQISPKLTRMTLIAFFSHLLFGWPRWLRVIRIGFIPWTPDSLHAQDRSSTVVVRPAANGWFHAPLEAGCGKISVLDLLLSIVEEVMLVLEVLLERLWSVR